MRLGILAVLATTLVVLSSGAAGASDELLLRGYGTPVVDGVIGPGEWDAAGSYAFMANRAPADGGGTVPARLYVMNDATNLYLALRVSVTNLGYSIFNAAFHAPPPNSFGDGNDVLQVSASGLEDLHYHFVPPYNYPWLADVDDGGSRDGTAVVRTGGEETVFEVSHPLNSTDDRHDFSLAVARRVEFYAAFHHCVTSCAVTLMPSSGYGKIVVVSGTRAPPNTSITAGPPDRSEVREERTFEFTGTDDLVSPSDLTFECKVDAEEWSSCESPLGGVVGDGWHSLRVRALDDMLNVDPSPARRRWRIDTKVPSRPSVKMRNGVYRFSSKDRGTPARRLRFRCGVDTKRLHSCGSHFRRAGGRVLRVRAVDPAGNQSGTTAVRLRRR